MAIALPTRVDRRFTRGAAEAVGSLTDLEQVAIAAIRSKRQCRDCGIYGERGGNSVVVTTIVRFTPKRRQPRTGMKRREDLAPVVEGLRKAGWLRFAQSFPDEPGGHFFLTSTAEWCLDAAER